MAGRAVAILGFNGVMMALLHQGAGFQDIHRTAWTWALLVAALLALLASAVIALSAIALATVRMPPSRLVLRYLAPAGDRDHVIAELGRERFGHVEHPSSEDESSQAGCQPIPGQSPTTQIGGDEAWLNGHDPERHDSRLAVPTLIDGRPRLPCKLGAREARTSASRADRGYSNECITRRREHADESSQIACGCGGRHRHSIAMSALPGRSGKSPVTLRRAHRRPWRSPKASAAGPTCGNDRTNRRRPIGRMLTRWSGRR